MVVREFNNAKPNSKIAEIINYYADPPKSDSDKLKIAIEISTAHKTKGREFRIVIVMNSIMSHFPLNFKKRELKVPDSLRRYESKKDEETLHDEEERRLYYVAITRAKYELVITYSLQDKKENKTEMSQFLNEIIKNSNVDYQKISIDNDI